MPDVRNAKPSRSRKILGGVLRFAVGAAILAALIAFLGPDWSEVGRRLEVRPGYVLLALGATTFGTTIGALRWRLLNEHLTPTRLPLSSYFHYIALTRLIGQFTSMLLMEFVGRGVGLRSAGSKQGLGRLVTPVILERVVDLAFPVVALGWALVWHANGEGQPGWQWALGGVLLVATFAIMPFVRPAARLILWGYGRLLRWRGKTFEAPDVVIPRRIAMWVTLLGLGRYVGVLTQFFGIGAAVGAVSEPGVVASAFPISQMSAVLALTPGGLGIQDAGWAGALSWQAMDETSIAMFLMAIHAGVIINFGVLSIVSLPFAGRRSKVTDPEEA